MPIYAYRCDECGAEKDVLQKFSDAPLTRCTSCGLETFRKVLTAPAFQLKGSGWYVTDFRDGGKKPQAGAQADSGAPEAATAGNADGVTPKPGAAKGAGDKPGGAEGDSKPAAKPATSPATPAATPAAGSTVPTGSTS